MIRHATIACGLVLALAGYLTRRGGDAAGGSPGASLLGSQTVPSAPSACGIDLKIALEPIHAAVHLSYRSQGLGEVRIVNGGARVLEGLTLAVGLPGRTDLLPEEFTATVPSIPPSGEAVVRILPHFSPAILGEGTSELCLRVRLTAAGSVLAEQQVLVPVVARSEMTWDEPERLAALIDPALLEGLIHAAIAADPPAAETLPVRNLALAAAAWDALASFGLRYLEDSPRSLAQALLGVPADRVSLPVETLMDRAGDCDDLTVLLASALEAAGVPTAVGLAESHVFILLDSGLGMDRLETSAVEAASVLDRGGRAWVPLEATCLTKAGSTLVFAWMAARSRLTALRSGEAQIFEVRKAWTRFPSVELAGSTPEAPRSLSSEAHRTLGASGREMARLLRDRVTSRALKARQDATGLEDGEIEGARREAAVFAGALYRDEAERILRGILGRKDDPRVRLDLADLMAADPRGSADLAAARRETETALGALDPLDLVAQEEARRSLERIASLDGLPMVASLPSDTVVAGGGSDPATELRNR